MFVLVTGVEMFPVMEKMNKPIPHHLSFLRPVSTVSVAAILTYELLPCVVSTPLLCMVKCHLPRSGMRAVRGHEPAWYSLCLSPALHVLLYRTLLKPKQGQESTETKGGSRRGGCKRTKGKGNVGAVHREGQGTIPGAKNLSVAMVSMLS